VAWAARTGTQLEDTFIYCTHKPCYACAKLLGNAGITAIQYEIDYENAGDRGVEMLKELGVTVVRW
jgi:dCMP deaminase